MSNLLAHSKEITLFKSDLIDTPLGPMVAIGNEEALYVLEFINRRGLERETEKFHKRIQATVIPGKTRPIDSIRGELDQYFKGTLKDFHTPIQTIGSPFQKSVWLELSNIPFGETRSYFDIAKALNNPGAVRAVGSANGANQIAIVIPCHRVINIGGKLGGYGGGIDRKEWLLAHEKKRAARKF